ncbi:MAG: ABC transporter ATP-binding protein [Syntrophobacteraceae bacterium]|nr:ABC transporter ATP-binding protein/permease [Desulfobacteraceae bacterium]
MNHEEKYTDDDYSVRMSDLRLWRKLLGFIAPQWRWVCLAVFLSLVITCTSLVLPRLVQVGLDHYILAGHMDTEAKMRGIGELSFVFLLLVSVGFVANFLQVLVLEWTGQRTMHALRQRLFSHVMNLNLSFFHSIPVGKLVTRLTNDVQNLYEMFTSVIITLFNDGVRLVGILAILFWMNWRLALILSATFPIMLVITLWFGRLSRNAFRRIRAHLAEINAFIQESVSGITVIQLFLREADLGRRFGRLNDRYRDAAFYQIHVFGIFVPLIEVMNSIAMALIVWYGGGEILRQHMTIGVLAAFISYMRLFFQPLRELSQKYTIVQSAMTSAERIFDLLEVRDSLPVPEKSMIPRNAPGSIEFSGVRFEYEPGRPAIRNVSFFVNAGETLAIVGATGSGKTTIVNLLERFYDPLDGCIRVGGEDLRELDLHWLREQIGLVMQDVFIVPGSIRENIALDRPISEERLERIVSLSQLSGFVKNLPDGPNTRIGEGGMNLSAGQKQLLAFARVLARDPGILILDEATANVDTETEMLIERAIQAAMAHRTSIVIAHRLSTIRRADRILVMDGGRIVEQGTHEELMQAGGLYQHLQTLQNGFSHVGETVEAEAG